MSNESLCLAHARWQWSAPDGSGVSGWQVGDMGRVVDELLELPVRTLFLEGVESEHVDVVTPIVRRASRAGTDVYVMAGGRECFDERFVESAGDAGVAGISVAIHGADAATHESCGGTAGSLAVARGLLETAQRAGVATAMHTRLRKANSTQLDALDSMASEWGIRRWVVSAEVGARGTMSGRELEQSIEHLAERARCADHEVVTRYAPFFSRMLGKGSAGALATLDERNGVCITPRGEVIPDPAIPIAIGQVGKQTLPWLYDNHPLLRALRDPDAVEGKCGVCEFRARCGGSRARALARTGNLFASDPACSYEGTGHRTRSREASRSRPEA